MFPLLIVLVVSEDMLEAHDVECAMLLFSVEAAVVFVPIDFISVALFLTPRRGVSASCSPFLLGFGGEDSSGMVISICSFFSPFGRTSTKLPELSELLAESSSFTFPSNVGFHCCFCSGVNESLNEYARRSFPASRRNRSASRCVVVYA